jgi:hypothetical protein
VLRNFGCRCLLFIAALIPGTFLWNSPGAARLGPEIDDALRTSDPPPPPSAAKTAETMERLQQSPKATLLLGLLRSHGSS